MKINKKNLKSIVLSMVLAAGMLLPASSFAQQRGGGLFGLGNFFESDEWFRDGALNPEELDFEGGITNQGIGEEAPLGSGLVILIGTGLGYVALKKKEDEQ